MIVSNLTSFVLALYMIPGLVMVLGSFFVPLVPHHFRHVLMLGFIFCSAFGLSSGAGVHWEYSLFGETLILHRGDHLTLPFGVIFHVAAALSVIYGWYEQSALTSSSGLAYGGAAIGAVHAGDLISLFIWWELTAIASVFLVLASRTDEANRAAVRYLLMQVLSGVLLLSGAAFVWRESGSFAFEGLSLETLGGWLIFISFGIKAAFPLVNGWMQDAYPKATIAGTVILSIFTTKMAIYALARGFAGEEILVWIGAIMVLLPALLALVEDDLRCVLSYSLNHQLGFMVVAIGIGTELSLNGAVAHAFMSVLYQGLLFMGVGAVLLRVGSARASDLGGLYKAMPLTLCFVLVGGMSIAGLPLLGGFVAKTIIVKSAPLGWVYLVLTAGSVAAVLHTAIRVPYVAFFNRDAGHKGIKEAPLAMILAMGLTSLGCIAIGIYPSLLIDILPFEMDEKIYSSDHVIGQLQLIVFALLAFAVMVRFYPQDTDAVLLNSDWIYRKLARRIARPFIQAGFAMSDGGFAILAKLKSGVVKITSHLSDHPISGPVIPGPAAFVQVALLAMILGVIYTALVYV